MEKLEIIPKISSRLTLGFVTFWIACVLFTIVLSAISILVDVSMIILISTASISISIFYSFWPGLYCKDDEFLIKIISGGLPKSYKFCISDMTRFDLRLVPIPIINHLERPIFIVKLRSGVVIRLSVPFLTKYQAIMVNAKINAKLSNGR